MSPAYEAKRIQIRIYRQKLLDRREHCMARAERQWLNHEIELATLRLDLIANGLDPGDMDPVDRPAPVGKAAKRIAMEAKVRGGRF